jgi:hypothetical protein
MLRHGLRLYVYPMTRSDDGQISTARTARVPAEQKKLLEYLLEIGQVREIAQGVPELMRISSYEVREMWLKGDLTWERWVPSEVLRHSRWKKFR